MCQIRYTNKCIYTVYSHLITSEIESLNKKTLIFCLTYISAKDSSSTNKNSLASRSFNICIFFAVLGGKTSSLMTLDILETGKNLYVYLGDMRKIVLS